MEIKEEIKSYLFCFILKSAVVRSEMEVVLRCEKRCSIRRFDRCQDFTMLYMVWLGSHFTVGVTRRLLLSSRVSSLVINLLTSKRKLPLIQKVNKLKTRRDSLYLVSLEAIFVSSRNAPQQTGRSSEPAHG